MADSPDVLKFVLIGATARQIEFEYTNWRGDDHVYVVKIESVCLGTYDSGGTHPNMPLREDNLQFVLNAHEVTRDGEVRDLGEHPGGRRRTFLISGLRKIVVK